MHEKATKTSPCKWKGPSSDCGKSDCLLVDATKESNSFRRANSSCGFVMARLRGTKYVKVNIRQGKIRDAARHKQAVATKSIAIVAMRKASILEEANMLMLMTYVIRK